LDLGVITGAWLLSRCGFGHSSQSDDDTSDAEWIARELGVVPEDAAAGYGEHWGDDDGDGAAVPWQVHGNPCAAWTTVLHGMVESGRWSGRMLALFLRLAWAAHERSGGLVFNPAGMAWLPKTAAHVTRFGSACRPPPVIGAVPPPSPSGSTGLRGVRVGV